MASGRTDAFARCKRHDGAALGVMRLLLLIAAALAQPEKLLERGTSDYNAGDSTKAQQAFVRLSTDQTAAPHLRAQAN